ncbi:MAG: porin [Holophagaceae bacterium]|nr:porin [Holophagaceae bacterium]
MKNRLAFLLAAGALAAPAFAGDLDYNIYGTIMTFVDNVKTADATKPAAAAPNALVLAGAFTGVNDPNRMRITSGTSNIGFKGAYKVTEDLSLTWQYESAIDVDSKDTSATNVLGGRNKGIGVASKTFGTVLVGSWDTPYKVSILMTGALRGLDPFDASLVGNPGFGSMATVTDSGPASSKNDACFNRRQGNSIQYWSPTVSGFNAKVLYSVNEQKTPTDNSAVQTSPTVISALLTYKISTLTLALGYEEHNDYFGLSQFGAASGAVGTVGSATNQSSKDTALALAAYYVIPTTGTRLVLHCEQLKYHNDDTVSGNIDEFKRNSIFFSAQQTFGAHKVWVNYGQASKGEVSRVSGVGTTSTDGLGAKQYSLNYAYALGKKADFFASYYTVKNDKAATYSCFPPPMNPTTGGPTAVKPGADTTGLGIGILYTF